jgi:hypothetical protein
MVKKESEITLPRWAWWIIGLFAIYGFVTFMDRMWPCRASEGCHLYADYAPADNQW